MYVKPPNERKKNHLNINFTDDDLDIVNRVRNAHPNIKLDKLFTYALLKVYGDGFSSDYNAIYLKALYQWKDKLEDEIEGIKAILNQKEQELCELNKEIDETMRDENEAD